MSLLYADTSALICAYFADEPDHTELREALLEGDDPVVTCEIARVELASAVRAAARGGRLRRWRDVLARFDADCQEEGSIMLLRLRSESVLPAARRLVLQHQVRTLDALHVAVAVTECPSLAGDDDVVFVTRDADQAKAVEALGFAVR